MDCATKLNIAVLIVNSIAALFAVIAAIIAVYGTIQARKASKASEEQFQKGMKELNRSINVSLFDMRSEMLIEVKCGSFKFDRTRANMLFDSEISSLIQEFDKENAEATRNSRLKEEFIKTVRQGLCDDTFDETADFLRQIEDYERMDSDDSFYEQMRESIRNKGITAKWLHGTLPEESEYVDYITVDDEYSRHYLKSLSLRKDLQEKMQKFIESSIQSNHES